MQGAQPLTIFSCKALSPYGKGCLQVGIQYEWLLLKVREVFGIVHKPQRKQGGFLSLFQGVVEELALFAGFDSFFKWIG